jgi:hypothetical protein
VKAPASNFMDFRSEVFQLLCAHRGEGVAAGCKRASEVGRTRAEVQMFALTFFRSDKFLHVKSSKSDLSIAMQVKGGPFIPISTDYCVSLTLLISNSVYLSLMHTLFPDYIF